jgi:hypothetical protein
MLAAVDAEATRTAQPAAKRATAAARRKAKAAATRAAAAKAKRAASVKRAASKAKRDADADAERIAATKAKRDAEAMAERAAARAMRKADAERAAESQRVAADAVRAAAEAARVAAKAAAAEVKRKADADAAAVEAKRAADAEATGAEVSRRAKAERAAAEAARDAVAERAAAEAEAAAKAKRAVAERAAAEAKRAAAERAAAEAKHAAEAERVSAKRAAAARAAAKAKRAAESESVAAVHSRIRRLFIELARRVRADRGKFVSVTVQPFVFMLDKEQAYVTALRADYRGFANVRDTAGRYHQKLVEQMIVVPKIAVFGIAENVVYWNHERADVTDLPAMQTWLLFENDSFEDVIARFMSPLSGVRFVDIVDVHPDGDVYDPYDVINHASDSVAFVYHKHAGAAARAGATQLEGWLLPPVQSATRPSQQSSILAWVTREPSSEARVAAREDVRIANACGYDIILAQFKAPIEALQKPDESRKDHKGGRYKDVVMTHKGLWRVFHGNKPFDAARMGLTLRQFRVFFERMSLQLTVLDIEGKELSEACHVPARPNKSINPRHTWVLHHGAHLFLLTDGLNSLCKLPRSVLAAPLDLQSAASADASTSTVSTHYHIGRKDIPVVFIDCIDKLASINLETIDEVVRVACPIEMSVALHELVTRCKVLPGVIMRGGKITALKLRVAGKEIVLSPPDSAPNDRTVMLLDKAEFDLYHHHEQALVRSVIKHETLSAYSPDVAQTFRELPRAPLHYSTGYAGDDLYDADLAAATALTGRKVLRTVTSQHDVSKAHTAAMLSLKCFPVFSVFDRFKPFTGEAIHDHAFYIVLRPDHITIESAEFLLLDNKVCLVTGLTARIVMQWPGVVIQSVLEPSRLVPTADALKEIRAIWDSSLCVVHKKFLVNKVVGLAGRRYNTRAWTMLFLNEAEARHYRGLHAGAQLLARRLGDSTIFFVNKEERAELVDGFYPIHHCVGDWLRRELYARAAKVARPVVAVKTDELAFAGIEPEVAKIHTFAGIGQWGVKCGSQRLPDKPHKERKSTFVPAALASLPVEVLHVADEFDAAEMSALLGANNHVLLRGVLPGVGKTSALERHCDKASTLLVAPTNKLAANFAAKGFHAVTLDRLLGLHVGDAADEKAHDMRINDYRTIVFDEIFFHGVAKLARIGDFMRRHEKLEDLMPRKFYATGDPYQNPPIERLDVLDVREYYGDAVASLFPYQLTLRVCKRVAKPEDQALLESIKERLFVSKENPADVLRSVAKPVTRLEDVKGSAICYLNKTAAAINQCLHEKATAGRLDLTKVGGASYYVGLDLVCCKRLEGVCFASDEGDFKRRGVLQKNFSFVVLKVADDALELDDLEGGRVRVPLAQALHHLAYAHASTGHSQQGLSMDGAVTIFDYQCTWEADGRLCGVSPEWVYTALSRARDMSQVYVFVGALGGTKTVVRAALERKIYGHRAADKRAGREWVEDEYITADAVFDLLAKQHGRCALCPTRLQLAWARGDHEQISVDRIDNARAHIVSNCQLTCLGCNKTKQ